MNNKHVAVFSALLAACACLCVFVINNIAEEVTAEAGTVPSPEAFLIRSWDIPVAFETPIREMDLSHPGDYPVRLKYCHRSYDAVLHIRDTQAPQAKTQNLTVLSVDPPQPEDFLTQVRDVTRVSAVFGTAPDLTQAGEQAVTILVTDEGGNTTEVSATLSVIIDTQPPRIEGVQTEFVLYQGNTVSYRSGVTVSDDIDEAPKFTIDSSGVDLSTPGEYTVSYIASDKSGNISVVESKVTVLEKRESYVELEIVHEAVADLLHTIVQDGMTAEEQVRAIYKWFRKNCGYINHSEKHDYRQTGYQMLQTHSGDCFGYFSLAKLMFEELGIPNIDVVKIKNYPGDNGHYWNLVSVDGGKTFYHFDATPRMGGGDFCLVSDTFLDNYSRTHSNSHSRDTSLYPATPKDSL